MEFYSLKTIKNIDIEYPDIYFTPEYGQACEYSDNAKWELCKYKDLIYCYLIKNNEHKIITPYGYSGLYYEKKETFNSFIPLFRKYLKSINIKEEIIRQNPYININKNINIDTNYELIKNKILFAIKTNTEEDYLKNILNSKTRNILTKANKIQLKCIIIKDNTKKNYINEFKEMYHKSMNRLETTKYYFFNDNYFNTIFNLKNTILSIIKQKDKTIGFGLFFTYNNFLHYHLSCNDKSNNCIHNFMIFEVLKKYGLNKLFILGCGVTENDSLSKFKKKISNIEFNYQIYKNHL